MIIATLLVMATVASERPAQELRSAPKTRAEFSAQDRKGQEKPPVGKPAGTPGRARGMMQTGDRGTSTAGVVTSITASALRITVGNDVHAFSLGEQTVVVGSKVTSTKDKPQPITKLVAVGDLVVVDYVTVGLIKRAETIRIGPFAPAVGKPAVGKPAATPATTR